ncbi:radical SAM protein [Candidatus Dojkabacteria bacterium]|nr:radical SAM protein [Candidatus Dojkabacteria bacterium]
MKISEIQAKSVLTKSKLPGADFVINPYSGCQFGCVYCYADFTRRFTGHTRDIWGEYVDIRTNAAEILDKELDRLNLTESIKRNKFKTGSKPVIFFGSVTDPYQGAEAKYKITRECLLVLAKHKLPIKISLLTKSPLVTRDIDLLKKLDITVGLTITSTDDKIGRLFEVSAPPANLRLKALKTLNENGISTYAFVGPLLPHFMTNPKKLKDLFSQIKETGTKEVWVEHINLSGSKFERLTKLVGDKLGQETLKKFKESQTRKYKDQLNAVVKEIIYELGLTLVGGDVIDHKRK